MSETVLTVKRAAVFTVLLLWPVSGVFAQANVCPSVSPDTRITPAAAFSNMRFTEEHAYGYTAMLWRAGPCVIGLFESAQGLAGDPPIGELQDVRYDPASRRISFSAKLTTGAVHDAATNNWVPARDRYTFEGVMADSLLSGVVAHTLSNNPNVSPTRESVALRPSREQAEFMSGPVRYGDWLAQWTPVLRARGPKW